jgi:NADH:ubiquinone oxidoreductase subunit 5 (subunit L)/multisubunit Na+/H+ antiporter MnhA subunit
LISFLVVLAATRKSGQISFSSWLLTAIAAPTSVSALNVLLWLLSGVYLLIRFSPTFRYWLNVAVLLISGSYHNCMLIQLAIPS